MPHVIRISEVRRMCISVRAFVRGRANRAKYSVAHLFSTVTSDVNHFTGGAHAHQKMADVVNVASSGLPICLGRPMSQRGVQQKMPT
jgi:hypothetical protein